MMLAKTTLDATLEGDCNFITDTPVSITDVLSPKTWAVSLTDILPSPTFSYPCPQHLNPTTLAADNRCKVFVNQTVDATICPGETVTIGGVLYDGPGSATDTLAGMAGCDTIRNITIHLLPQP
jgi:hypothetical protein